MIDPFPDRKHSRVEEANTGDTHTHTARGGQVFQGKSELGFVGSRQHTEKLLLFANKPYMEIGRKTTHWALAGRLLGRVRLREQLEARRLFQLCD